MKRDVLANTLPSPVHFPAAQWLCRQICDNNIWPGEGDREPGTGIQQKRALLRRVVGLLLLDRTWDLKTSWMMISTYCFLFCRRHRKLLLRAGASHETASYPNDSQPAAELWTVQENGDLCVCLKNYHIRQFLDCIIAGVLVIFFSLFNVSLLSVFSFQRPHKATAEEMTKYHSDDYIKFLRSIRPDNMSEFSKQMQRCESCFWSKWAVCSKLPQKDPFSFLWQTLIILTVLRQWGPWAAHSIFTAVLSKLCWC